MEQFMQKGETNQVGVRVLGNGNSVEHHDKGGYYVRRRWYPDGTGAVDERITEAEYKAGKEEEEKKAAAEKKAQEEREAQEKAAKEKTAADAKKAASAPPPPQEPLGKLTEEEKQDPWFKEENSLDKKPGKK